MTTIGRNVVKALIREPVKEAVHEALVEEQAREGAVVRNPSAHEEQDSDDGGRGLPIKTLAAVVAIAGVILLVRRRRGGNSAELTGEPATRQRSGTARTAE